MKQSRCPLSVGQNLLLGSTITTLAVTSFLTPSMASSASPTEETLEDNPKTVIDEVWQLVNNEFVDRSFHHVDWQRKRQELLGRSYANRKQAYTAIREALKEIGDPYTRFLEPEEFSALTTQTSGELSGVGVRLAVDKRTKDLIVIEALKSSPALAGGIQQGDRVIRINGKPTALMTLEQAIKEMEGEIGTDVNLQISRRSKGIFEVTLTRAQIEIPSVSYSIKEESQIKVGYIRLDEFSSHAAEQMKLAIEDLNQKKVSGYVLDLRGNPGGLLFASVDIARMWMKSGKIVSTVDRRGGDRHFDANGTALTELPLVILVNEGSASASEILAGALKENGRATVVGMPTYGKATVQSVHSLSDGSGLAVTIARYFPPNGENITKKGIRPDVQVGLTNDQQLQLRNNPDLLGTNSDPQYKRAITVLQTRSPAQIKPSGIPKPLTIRPE
jgi:carboxyl-terminal processing protease